MLSTPSLHPVPLPCMHGGLDEEEPPALDLGEACIDSSQIPTRTLTQQMELPKPLPHNGQSRSPDDQGTKQDSERQAAAMRRAGGNCFGCWPVKKGHPWVVYFEAGVPLSVRKALASKDKAKPLQAYQSKLRTIGSCHSWASFEARFGAGVPPGASISLFKAKVKPVWEDPANQGLHAGKWILPTKSNAASLAIMEVLTSAILDKKIAAHGLVQTHRFGQAMVMVWTEGSSAPLERPQLKALLGEAAEGLDGEETRIRFKPHRNPNLIEQKPNPDASNALKVGPDSDYEKSPVLDAQPPPDTAAKKTRSRRQRRASKPKGTAQTSSS